MRFAPFARRATALAATFAALALTANANAAVVSSTGDSFNALSTPPSAVGNNWIKNNSTLFGFDESTVTLAKKLTLDYVTAGGSSLAKNTQVHSFYLSFDPKKQSTWNGTLTFDHDILGLAYTTSRLGNTKTLLGLSTVNYGGNSGLELPADSYSVSGRTLTLSLSDKNLDNLRVITAVPEPSTYAMIGAGLLAVGFMARRRTVGATA